MTSQRTRYVHAHFLRADLRKLADKFDFKLLVGCATTNANGSETHSNFPAQLDMYMKTQLTFE